MELLNLEEFIELHTILSGEYQKCPLTAKNLRFYANCFAELLRARLRECSEAGDRRRAESLKSEIQASIGGIAQPLLGKLQKATVTEMRLFNRQWNVLHPPRPRELSKSEAYEKMLRSMGH